MKHNTSIEQKPNAAMYIRLSREDGDKAESDSIANQRHLIADYLKKFALASCKEYVDDGFSGVNFDRPGFSAMMDDVRAGLIDLIVVKDLSRFGRNWIESGRYIERTFPFLGVRFIAINDNYDSLIAENNNDNISLPFKNLINDAYAGDISVKIRSQLTTKCKSGDFIGSFAVFGYAKDPKNHNKLIVDEFAANIVRDIFKWRLEGLSNAGIATRLNDAGVLSPSEYKKACGHSYSTGFKKNSKSLWSSMAVYRILKNEVYIGVLEQGKRAGKSHKIKGRLEKPKDEWIRVEDSHEPIISYKDFQLVQELLDKDVRITPGGDKLYIFSGFLKCSDCGENMIRKLVPSGDKKYVYYVCSTHKADKSCSSHRISESAIESAVLQTINAHIENILEIEDMLKLIDNAAYKALDIKKIESQILAKTKELDNYQMRKFRLYEDFQDGILEQDEYDKYKIDFTKNCNDAENALRSLNSELEDILAGDRPCDRWIEHFKEYRNFESLSRGLVVNLIEKINVYEKGKINIHFRYHYDYEIAKSLAFKAEVI